MLARGTPLQMWWMSVACSQPDCGVGIAVHGAIPRLPFQQPEAAGVVPHAPADLEVRHAACDIAQPSGARFCRRRFAVGAELSAPDAHSVRGAPVGGDLQAGADLLTVPRLL